MPASPKIEVFRDKRQGWSWRIRSANGRIIARGESHTRKRDVYRAVRAVIDTFLAVPRTVEEEK